MLQKKFQTPLVFQGSSYMYDNYESMKYALARTKKNIEEAGLPRSLAPLVFAVTGTGRCAQGSLEVLKQLPHVLVSPSDLRNWLA